MYVCICVSELYEKRKSIYFNQKWHLITKILIKIKQKEEEFHSA